jgi:shikimate kinase
MSARLALIGHSAAGKSCCLSELGIDHRRADMDAALGTQHCPSLLEGIQWLGIESKEQPIVVVSNHENMLKAMWLARKGTEHVEFFNALRFVYLRKPKDQLAKHLATPNSAGNCRDLESQRYTLSTYERFDGMYRELAHYTIDCDAKEVSEVAVEVRELLGNGYQRS